MRDRLARDPSGSEGTSCEVDVVGPHIIPAPRTMFVLIINPGCGVVPKNHAVRSIHPWTKKKGKPYNDLGHRAIEVKPCWSSNHVRRHRVELQPDGLEDTRRVKKIPVGLPVAKPVSRERVGRPAGGARSCPKPLSPAFPQCRRYVHQRCESQELSPTRPLKRPR